MLCPLMTSYLKKMTNGKTLFKKAFIPLNSRSKNDKPNCPINDDGIPVCPKDNSLLMLFNGYTHQKR